MRTIDKIALRLSQQISPDGWLCGSDPVLEYTHTLLAELSKDIEPVAEVAPSNNGSGIISVKWRNNDNVQRLMYGDKLFTNPAIIESLHAQLAEQKAKIERLTHLYDQIWDGMRVEQERCVELTRQRDEAMKAVKQAAEVLPQVEVGESEYDGQSYSYCLCCGANDLMTLLEHRPNCDWLNATKLIDAAIKESRPSNEPTNCSGSGRGPSNKGSWSKL